ncbi:UreD urease accessory protein-domain-containing protein [Multifurca ochricompacta]|uniref:UreD urease accessory protein-domain-containing protein n=1 Tax=Multifurca ochricompacta TaxID=376703 RepID=A0AAD4MFR3_9AGAM|nr:UreD urease accessory protein-domain-containing protein [Multifurca ochricompacta]
MSNATVVLDAGDGNITARIHNNHVVFPVLSYTYPLKLLSPRIQQDGVAVVYMMTYGGGLVGGDRISLSINVEQDAQLVLLSQGSTKVFKARSGVRAAARSTARPPDSTTMQRLDVSIAAGGALFLLPDPVTCFRNASYRQAQTFRLAHGASAALLDWYTSGRRARGEEWAFARYYSVNEVFVSSVRSARDVVLLEAMGTESASDVCGEFLPRRTLADRMGPYSCYATLLLYGPLVQGVIRELEDRVQKITVFQVREPLDVLWSLSPVSGQTNGRIVRVAGKETEEVKKWLSDALRGGLVSVIGDEVYSKTFI